MRFLSLDAKLSRRTIAWVAWYVMVAPSANAQESAGRVQSDLRLRIEVNESSFHAGEPILLRLTLVNVSDHPTMLASGNHTGMALISVYDSTGKEIRVTVSPIGGRIRGPSHMLEPGGEIPIAYQGAPGGQWFDLRDWGYELWQPGSYTIADLGRSSNRVQITVLERIPGTDSAAITQAYYSRRKADIQQTRSGTVPASDTREAAWARMDSIRAWKQARDSSRKE
jgi:hypothetical protein